MYAAPVQVEATTFLTRVEIHGEDGIYDYVLARPVVLQPGDRYWVEASKLYLQRGDDQPRVLERDVATHCVRRDPK